MIEYIICKNCMHNLSVNDIARVYPKKQFSSKIEICLHDVLCSLRGREIEFYSCCSDQGGHAKDETCDMWRAHNEM